MDNYLHQRSRDTESFYVAMREYFGFYPDCTADFLFDAIYAFVNHNTTVLFDSANNLKDFHKFLIEVMGRFEFPSIRARNRILNLYADVLDFLNLMSCRTHSERMEIARCIVEHMNHQFDSCILEMRHVMIFIQSGNVTLMRVLVQNWDPCQPLPGDWFEDVVYELKYANIITEKEIPDPGVQVAGAVQARFELGGYSPFKPIFTEISGEKWKVHRQIRTLWSVLALVCGDRSRDYAECLRLFYQTIPDDIVTFQEMKDLLLLINKDPECKDPTISGFLARLGELYPETRGPRKPRKLLHLCRVIIKAGILESGRTLPEAVPRLIIPELMKDYLLFADS